MSIIQPTRKFTIVAQDPLLHDPFGRILTAEIDVPNEDLEAGPCGYRVQVIDYDASAGRLYKPWTEDDRVATAPDPARKPAKVEVEKFNRSILGDPRFHQQNVYAIAMRTLAHFERALGRRVSWSYGRHQLKVAPHAFVEANAFYSSADEGLVFGYFRNPRGHPVFTCLSHDIVAHETTHALLDGLQPRYMEASLRDQFAFHEGFADVVALLSAFSLPEVVHEAVKRAVPSSGHSDAALQVSQLTIDTLQDGILFGLGEQFEEELSGVHGSALRRSVRLVPSPDLLTSAEYKESHRRGEILVAAVLHAFMAAYLERLSTLGKDSNNQLPPMRVAEEGADIASRLLKMAIRAIDYSPPADLQFSDYLSAILTADTEIHPDDSRYRLRAKLIEGFGRFGIKPASQPDSGGLWTPPEADLEYGLAHFESLQQHVDEVFRFLWVNRKKLGLSSQAHTKVTSVEPCLRVNVDGFTCRETVANYVQILLVRARDLGKIKIPEDPKRAGVKRGIQAPDGMSPGQLVKLMGGGALIFNEFGQLKHHIRNSILNAERQTRRLLELWDDGYFPRAKGQQNPFAALHRMGARPALPAANREEGSW